MSPRPRAKDIGRRPIPHFGTIDIGQVIPDPNQPRAEFSEENIEQLANSIREKGQLSPIRVRWSEADQKWIIVFGEQRWRAVKRAGLPTIQCFFHDEPIRQSETLQQQLIENCLRTDLKPIEEAQAFACLMEINGWNGRELGEALQVSTVRISRALALLKLPSDVQQKVTQGQISKRAAYELSKLENEEVQKGLANDIDSNGLSSQTVAKSVRQRKGKAKPKSTFTKQTFIVEGGWRITASRAKKSTYHEMLKAVEEVRQEIQHRIDNGIQIF